MESVDCPDCKKLFEGAREAIQHHIRAQGNWQIASLRRDEVGQLEELRMLQDRAAKTRAKAVDAYRQHAITHRKQP